MFNIARCSICSSKFSVSRCNNCKKYFCSSHLYTIIDDYDKKIKDKSYCDDCIIEIYTCSNCNLKYDAKELIKIEQDSEEKEMCPFCFSEVNYENYHYKIKEIK